MKFFALIIMPDMSITRMWMDTTLGLQLIKERNCKIYRNSNDQILVPQADGSALWQDVVIEEIKNG